MQQTSQQGSTARVGRQRHGHGGPDRALRDQVQQQGPQLAADGREGRSRCVHMWLGEGGSCWVLFRVNKGFGLVFF